MPNLIYLATPYNHRSANVRRERYEAACKTAGLLLSKGVFVYSPIAHTHSIANIVDLPASWEFWKEYDEIMLSRCNELWVIMMDGWLSSVGIAAEIAIARKLNKPIRYWRIADGFPLIEMAPVSMEALRDYLGWTPVDKVIEEFANIAHCLDILGGLDSRDWLGMYGDACTAALGQAVRSGLAQRGTPIDTSTP